MINHTTLLLALRTQAATMSAATTGATALSATATGYARAAGSFVTDGFKVGMEVAGTSFTTPANNTSKVITAVSALALTCAGCTAEASGTRTLTVGLPALRSYENVPFTPTGSRWYVEEDYLPGPLKTITIGSFSEMEGLPQYVLKLYGVAGLGGDALFAVADALLAVFPPHQALASGTTRVRGDLAPYRGQLLQAGPAPVIVVTIPLFVRSVNSI